MCSPNGTWPPSLPALPTSHLKDTPLCRATALLWRPPRIRTAAIPPRRPRKRPPPQPVVAKDAEAAFVCYEKAAQGGDFRGQFCLAGMLAAQGRTGQALAWLRKVPLTATPAFREEAGRVLLQSPHEEFRRIGEQMLARAAVA